MYRICVGGLIEAWKELGELGVRFCTKLMGIRNCPANGFADMELGRESMRGRCTGKILKYWLRIMCLDMGDAVRQYNEGRRV
jgi:hypothetical protein